MLFCTVWNERNVCLLISDCFKLINLINDSINTDRVSSPPMTGDSKPLLGLGFYSADMEDLKAHWTWLLRRLGIGMAPEAEVWV